MDTLKLAILACIAGGMVLYMANASIVQSILISAGVCIVVTIVAVIRYKVDPPTPKKDDTPDGPTIM